MNGKWILSVKDGGMVSLSDAFCPTWRNQGLFLKYSPSCCCRAVFVDIGCGLLGAMQYSKVGRMMRLSKDAEAALLLALRITFTTFM